jgi:hypothetical protein
VLINYIKSLHQGLRGIGMKEKKEPSERESGSILKMVSAITREVPEREWERVPADLSKNVDHYLYGIKRTKK